MSVLLVGGCGRIGRRYAAILRSLKVPFEIFDPLAPYEPSPEDHSHWIIASPTITHASWCLSAIHLGKTFLCEKPLSIDIHECELIVDNAARANAQGFVVCNYKYVVETNLSYKVHGKLKPGALSYDYFNPGDELEWAAAQLIYLDPQVKLADKSPIWRFKINRSFVDYQVLEKSYVKMIRDFTSGDYSNLWTLEDGLKMTQAVLKRLG